MEEVTDEAFDKWREAHPDPDHNMDNWARLIDDGWGTWTGPLELLKQFLEFLSIQVPSLKFTMEYTCPRVNCPEAGEDHECGLFLHFLDTTMFIDEEGKIQTDLYRKPGTKCQYLSPDSAHPRHIFSNIPKSLVHRIVRIVSVPGMREVRLEELRLLLLSRGYKAGELRQAMEYGMGLDRELSLEKVERENKNEGRVRYNITYDPLLPAIPPILRKNWKVMVDEDQRLLKAFPKPPMACLKRGPNLSDRLIRAKLPPMIGRAGTRATNVQRVGFSSCKAGKRECSLCPFSGPAADKKTTVTQVKIHHSGMILEIKQPITCRDSFVLYILSCRKPGCLQPQYGGLCSRPVYLRVAEHLGDIKSGNIGCPVGKHWQEPGHTLEHLEFIPVEKVGARDRLTLRMREADLINRTGVLLAGLNLYR